MIRYQKKRAVRWDLASKETYWQEKIIEFIDSSALDLPTKIFKIRFSNCYFYENLRGWNLIFRAIGVIWPVLSDKRIKKIFWVCLLILRNSSDQCQCIWAWPKLHHWIFQTAIYIQSEISGRYVCEYAFLPYWLCILIVQFER